VTAVGDNTLSVKLSPGCKTVVLVDDDGEEDYDKAEKWTLTDSTPLVEYDFQNDIQFMRAWSRDASCCMAGTSCLKCANGMEVVAPEVCDTKRRYCHCSPCPNAMAIDCKYCAYACATKFSLQATYAAMDLGLFGRTEWLVHFCIAAFLVLNSCVLEVSLRCRLEPLAPHIGPQFVARAIILADVSFDTLSEVAKQLGATSSSATKLGNGFLPLQPMLVLVCRSPPGVCSILRV
jgi:hypothetical protein